MNYLDVDLSGKAPESGLISCSPARPWGIHGQLLAGLCGRCGWINPLADEAKQRPASPSEAPGPIGAAYGR